MGLAGLVVGVLAFFVVPASSTVEARIVIICALPLSYLILLLGHAAVLAHGAESPAIPRVAFAKRAPKAYEGSVALLLLEPSDLFILDCAVSVFSDEDGLERLIGLGYVINVQGDKRIQVIVTRSLCDDDEWTPILNSRSDSLKKLIVKPTVPRIAME